MNNPLSTDQELQELSSRMRTSWMIFQIALPFIILSIFTAAFTLLKVEHTAFNILGKGDLLFSWGILMLALSVDLNTKMANGRKEHIAYVIGILVGFVFLFGGVLIKCVTTLVENGIINLKEGQEEMIQLLTLIGIVGWIVGMIVTTTIKYVSIGFLIQNLKHQKQTP